MRTADEVYCRIIEMLLDRRGIDPGWGRRIRAMQLSPEKLRVLDEAEEIGRQVGTLCGGWRVGRLMLSRSVRLTLEDIDEMVGDRQPRA